MKKYLILLIIPLMIVSSCMKDMSAYYAQERENVTVDPNNTEPGEDPQPGPNELIPGITLIKLNITEPDGTIVERRFKYFMPASIDPSKPISLIFDFHGSYTFEEGTPAPDPISSVSQGHVLNQMAIKENCIVVFPAGEALASAVNWQNSDKHVPFFDGMIDFFKSKTPLYDINRVYSCGHSSGAIFSYYLAFVRSNVLAAVVPVSGQMALTNQTIFPDRCVPVRAFNGTVDASVNYQAAVKNITIWAEKVGGYFTGNVYHSPDTIDIAGYKKIAISKWNGGKGDIELYSVIGEGHSVSWSRIRPYMWEFMRTHTLNGQAVECFLNVNKPEIALYPSKSTNITLSFFEGSNVTVQSAPDGVICAINGNILKVTAPDDFHTSILEGTIIVMAEREGAVATKEIKYKLNYPKTHFTVGEIYYNSNDDIVGVVCWVNPSNNREAKVISHVRISLPFGALDAYTPSETDGIGNTDILVENANSKGLTAENCAVLWATSYDDGNGWYLPSLQEYYDLGKNSVKINETIKALGGTLLEATNTSWYQTSTFVFTTKAELWTFDFDPKYYGKYIVSSLTSKISTRAIKSVTIK